MKFSEFGQRFTQDAAITRLMDDLNQGILSDDLVMLGGGNPAPIEEMANIFRASAQAALDDNRLLQAMMNYDGPGGNSAFIAALAQLFQREYGWDITPEHIALTNGSQNAFFYLFNLFGGDVAGASKKVLLPLLPEYIGYADTALHADMFVGIKPIIDIDEDDKRFKYHIDFAALEQRLDDDIGLICVSRPTNPSGNVLTDNEIERLMAIAKQADIPLLIDNAYGTPFPNILFEDAKPYWDDHVILSMSLSKLGLPGLRCGIVIADPQIIRALGNLSGVISLSPGGMGPAIAQRMVENGDILRVSEAIIKPFYARRSAFMQAILEEQLGDLPLYQHRSEGAIFLWLWAQELPISSLELYQLLKQDGLIVVPGEYFFPGLEQQQWPHMRQCLRLNYSQSPQDIEKGIGRLAQRLRQLYG